MAKWAFYTLTRRADRVLETKYGNRQTEENHEFDIRKDSGEESRTFHEQIYLAGQDGWELVSVTQSNAQERWHFKKRIEDDTESESRRGGTEAPEER